MVVNDERLAQKNVAECRAAVAWLLDNGAATHEFSYEHVIQNLKSCKTWLPCKGWHQADDLHCTIEVPRGFSCHIFANGTLSISKYVTPAIKGIDASAVVALQNRDYESTSLQLMMSQYGVEVMTEEVWKAEYGYAEHTGPPL